MRCRCREFLVDDSGKCVDRLRAGQDPAVDEKSGRPCDAESYTFLRARSNRGLVLAGAVAGFKRVHVHADLLRDPPQVSLRGLGIHLEHVVMKLPELALLIGTTRRL